MNNSEINIPLVNDDKNENNNIKNENNNIKNSDLKLELEQNSEPRIIILLCFITILFFPLCGLFAYYIYKRNTINIIEKSLMKLGFYYSLYVYLFIILAIMYVCITIIIKAI